MQISRVARLMIVSAAAIPHVNTFSFAMVKTPMLSFGMSRGVAGVRSHLLQSIESQIRKHRLSTLTPAFSRSVNYRSLTKHSASIMSNPKYDQEQLRLLDEDECILVNEKDEVVGHGSKKQCHLMSNILAGTALHRAFSIFLFNTKGELLLQKRSADKILFPNRWTNTCCSHPLYNDQELDDPVGSRSARLCTLHLFWPALEKRLSRTLNQHTALRPLPPGSV